MKYTLLLILLVPFCSSFADSICGDDSRLPAKDRRIGRLTFNNSPACTVTLIGKACALSAGHCQPFMSGGIVEFDTPMSIGPQIQSSNPKDQYTIDPKSIAFENNGYGRDWAVFKLNENTVTKSLPGSVYGSYRYGFEKVKEKTLIQIAGYGLDDRDYLNTNGTLQSALGKVTEISEYFHGDGSTAVILNHDVDTMEGDSGAVVVSVKDSKIIAIHTHGSLSCNIDPNKGTLLSENKKLQKAIVDCLK